MKRRLGFKFLLGALAVVLIAVVACAKATPTPTPRPTATPTPVPTAATGVTPTPTATPTTVAAEIPNPKNPIGTITLVEMVLTGSPGSDPSLPTFPGRNYGVMESLFGPKDGDWGAVMLAESYELASDLSSAVIKLRKGVKFHPKGGDWGEMTAEDVAFTINHNNPSLNPTSIGSSASILSALFGTNPVEVVDQYTIRFKFNNYDVRWNSYLINQEGQGGLNTAVTSKKAFDTMGQEWLRQNAVGTGPFMVVEHKEDLQGIYEKVPYEHWSGKNAKIKQFKVLASPEQAARLAMLQTGEADAVYVAPKDLVRVKKMGYLEVGSGASTQEGVFFTGNLWESTNALTGEDLMPTIQASGVFARDIPWVGNKWKPDDGDNPPGIDDMEQARLVRWAAAISVDREAIIEYVLGGIGNPVYVTYFNAYDPNWEDRWNYTYDPQEAERLLERAGYPRTGGAGYRFEMPLFIGPELGGGEAVGGEIGDAIAGYWEKVGIKTPVLKYAYAVYRPGVVGRTTVTPYLTSCDEGADQFPFDWPKGLVMTTLSRGGFSCGFEVPEILDIYKKNMAEPDKQKRINNNKEMIEFLYHWALNPGYVSVPNPRFVNPKSITSWEMEIGNNINHPENIVPAR